jgi:ketosteroid isomerase-like protein
MKNLLILAPLFCAAVSNGQPATKDSIIALQAKYDKAVTEKDSVMLTSLFHDNMIITGGDGTRRNKKAEISDCVDPRYNVVYFTTKNVEADVFGSTAIVRGDLEWQLKNGDNVNTLSRRITFTWSRLNGRWMIVAQHIGMPPRR